MAELSPEQQAHRVALGRAIAYWFRLNGWSQQVPHDWGVAIAGDGGQSSGPHNSQISLAQRGKLDGKPGFFIALGAFNAAIATQDMTGVITRALKDRLTGAEAFLLDDDTPARATDFFSLFIGELPIPSRYAVSDEPMSEQAVSAANEQLRTDFKEGAKDRMLTPAEAWPVLWKNMALPTKVSSKLKDVLSGWGDYTAEDLADGLVMASLKGWAKRG
jgi:hypothetical protein